MQKRIQDLRNRADELAAVVEQVELNADGFGTLLQQARDEFSNELEAVAYDISRLGARTDSTLAAIEQEAYARVTAVDALSQVIDTLVARTDNNEAALSEQALIQTDKHNALAEKVAVLESSSSYVFDTITAQSQAIEGLQTTTWQQGQEVAAAAHAINGISSEINQVYEGIDKAKADAIDVANTHASYLNGELEIQASNLRDISAIANGAKAVTNILTDAFITENADGTMVAQAGYKMRLDANGVITGMEAIARNDPDAPPVSQIKFSAETILFNLGGREYKITQDQPVLQQVGGGTQSGDSTWRIRNAHVPILLPVNGTWIGGGAEVKVYTDDGV